MRFTILTGLLAGASLLSSIAGQTETRAKSSLRVSGNSLQSSLTAIAQTEIPKLESDKIDLDQILESFAEAILNDVSDIVLQIFDEPDTMNAKEVALEFSNAVNESFFEFLEIEKFEKVDLDSICQQIEASIETILLKIGASSDSLTVTEELVNAIITAIGDGFSEVTAATFSYQFTLSEAAVLMSTSPTPSPPPLTSTDLFNFLEQGNTLKIKSEIQKLLQTGGELTVLEFFISVTNNQTLYEPMAEVFVEMFSDAKFPFEAMSDPLQEAYELNSNITIIIEQAIKDSISTKNYDGLIQFISVGLDAPLGQVNEAVLKSLEGVVQNDLCSPTLADILVQSKDASKSITNFQLGILGSARLSECLSKGKENQFQFSITLKLSGKKVSNKNIKSVFSSLQSLSVQQVTDILVESMDAGHITGVGELLVKYFSDDSVTSEKLGLLIAAMVSANQTSIVLDSILKTGDYNNLVEAFDFAFFSSKELTQSLIVELIADSVDEDECGLSDILSGVYMNATSAEISSINQLLIEGGASACAVIEPTVEALEGLQPELSFQDYGEPQIEIIVAEDDTSTGIEESIQTSPIPIPIPQVKKFFIPGPVLEIFKQNSDDLELCTDIVPPPGNFSCEQQAAWGKCETDWMISGGFCEITCGKCCTDVPPDDRFTCAQQKQFGKCDEPWMKEHQYCQETCGRCVTPGTHVASSVASPLPPTTEKKEQGCNCAPVSAEYTDELVKRVVAEVIQELLHSQ